MILIKCRDFNTDNHEIIEIILHFMNSKCSISLTLHIIKIKKIKCLIEDVFRFRNHYPRDQSIRILIY